MSSILDKLLIIAGEPTKEKEDRNKCNHNTWMRWRTYRRKDNEHREKNMSNRSKVRWREWGNKHFYKN